MLISSFKAPLNSDKLKRNGSRVFRFMLKLAFTWRLADTKFKITMA